MSADTALFDLEGRPKSEEEREVERFIADLAEQAPLTPQQAVVASMCRALARSIAEGNRKGRSVASDVERLMATMAVLDPPDPDLPTDDQLTPAERELFDALRSSPRDDPAEAGYAEELSA